MFLDTASLPDIEYYRDLGILKGITTNPTLLKQHPAPRHEQLAAILAGIAGCAYVAPYVNRMENNGIDPYTVIATSRRYYDNHAIDCRIVGASFKNTRQILHALDAGAHTCTLSPELLRQMLENAVANAAIRVFNADGGL